MNMNPRSIWLSVALVLGLAGIVLPETLRINDFNVVLNWFEELKRRAPATR